MPFSVLNAAMALLTFGLIVVHLALNRMRRLPAQKRATRTSLFRWPWTLLLVMAIAGIVIERGGNAVPWLVAIFAAIETLLTWTLHVVSRQAEDSPAKDV
jgi:hypothetical protein